MKMVIYVNGETFEPEKTGSKRGKTGEKINRKEREIITPKRNGR